MRKNSSKIFIYTALEQIFFSLYISVKTPLSHVQLFVTPWTVARQAPLSLEFSRQEYWSVLLFPSSGDLP